MKYWLSLYLKMCTLNEHLTAFKLVGDYRHIYCLCVWLFEVMALTANLNAPSTFLAHCSSMIQVGTD